MLLGDDNPTSDCREVTDFHDISSSLPESLKAASELPAGQLPSPAQSVKGDISEMETKPADLRHLNTLSAIPLPWITGRSN